MAIILYYNYSKYVIILKKWQNITQNKYFRSRRDWTRVSIYIALRYIPYLHSSYWEVGSAPGELDLPFGVVILEVTHQIFIANFCNDRVEIFSETGEYLYQVGVGQLCRPYGLAIHGDSVYVSYWGDDTVSKFSLTETCCVRRIGGSGSNTDNSTILDSSQLIPLALSS